MKIKKYNYIIFVLFFIIVIFACKKNVTEPEVEPLDGRGGGVIAFSPGDKMIDLMNADGSGRIRLIDSSRHASGPSWSPNGDRIAFQARNNTATSIYVMNADGNDIIRLTYEANVFDNEPCWTVNDKILFGRGNPAYGNGEIWMVNPDGGDLHRVGNIAGATPRSSNDGSKIVFASLSDGDWEIWIMNADGSNPIQITDNQFNDWLPSWSPDFDRIAFESDRDGNHEIYTMDINGHNVYNLTNNGYYNGCPRWSPDGSKIVFESSQSGGFEIYKMTTTGSSQERLTFTSGAYRPDWRP